MIPSLSNLRLLSALFLFACGSFAAENGPVYVIPLKTEVSPSQFYFLRRALKEAERAGACAVVLDMDTYGGRVDSAIDSMDALLKTNVPTFTYINSKALSAGSFIALATGKIYMAPNGVIGAAAPVTSTGQDLEKTMNDKLVSALTAMVRAAAQKTGHNPELAAAFIRKENEFKIGDVVIDKADSLLTLSAQDAIHPYDGKPLLAEGIASTLDDMLKQASLATTVRHVDPTGFERMAGFLTGISTLLLVGGILGAFIEIKTPGFGIAGIFSTICFMLFFAGSYLAGLAGWEAAIMFFIGLALVVSEIFVHPGTVLPGILGFLLLVGSLLWAMVDHYPGQSLWPTGDMMLRPLLNLAIAFAVATLALYFIAKRLPHTSLYRRIVLTESVPTAGVLQPGARPTSVAIGMEGTAHTMLRPSGKADIEGRLVDVVSQGDLIPAGAALRVLAVEGARVVVVAA